MRDNQEKEVKNMDYNAQGDYGYGEPLYTPSTKQARQSSKAQCEMGCSYCTGCRAAAKGSQ